MSELLQIQGRTYAACYKQLSTPLRATKSSWKSKVKCLYHLHSLRSDHLQKVVLQLRTWPQKQSQLMALLYFISRHYNSKTWISLKFEQVVKWHSFVLLQWKIIALQSVNCSEALPLKPKDNILKCQHGLLLISFRWEQLSKVFTTISNWLPCILTCQKSLHSAAKTSSSLPTISP